MEVERTEKENEIYRLNQRLHELQRDYDRIVRDSGWYRAMSERLVEILMAVTKADKKVAIEENHNDDDPT